MASSTRRTTRGNRPKGTGKPKSPSATGFIQDRLSPEQLRAQFGYTAEQILIDPDIKRVFDTAVREQWQGEIGKALFTQALEATDWWKRNNQYMRRYLLTKVKQDADWKQLVQASEEAVRQEAMAMGVTLSPEQVKSYTEQSMMYGWYEPENKYLLRRAMQGQPSSGGGDIMKIGSDLQNLAFEMGIQYDQNWYDSAAKSVASQATDTNFWASQIRDRAAQMFPGLRDQIMAGQSVRNIASPYIALMQEEWGVPGNSIQVSDPVILGALGQSGGQGMMNLDDFQRRLRQDPRWLNTDKAQNSISNITDAVMQMFGLRG